LNVTVTVPVVVFCVIVSDTLLQFKSNTLLPPPKRKGVLKLPVVIDSVTVKTLLPAVGTVTFTQ